MLFSGKKRDYASHTFAGNNIVGQCQSVRMAGSIIRPAEPADETIPILLGNVLETNDICVARYYGELSFVVSGKNSPVFSERKLSDR